MKFDIAVIGGGHAGIEAAAIAAKMNVSVVLITSNIDLVGQMSCNPAIGGIAKGNIVREVDALGGIMGKIADKAGIQFRMLNKSKGSAVWGNRAQEDKRLYRKWCKIYLENQNMLTLYQATVTQIIIKDSKISGLVTQSGETIETKAVILAMGTFLNGVGHIGMESFACGRSGEAPSLLLSESIQECGIKAGRLKTGTPARVDGRTLDFSKMEQQNGDDIPWPFSFSTTGQLQNRAVCWVIRTQPQTHKIIYDNLNKSALYGGKIKGIGPRYCPSIEDKLVKFGERDGHTLFLEPEGLDTHEMYINGFSTSLPFEIQVEMIQSLPGFEKAHIVRPAYAIEYDYFFPTQLYPSLESRVVENLYFAGQINGTSGYEEAACQGIVAGINAAEKIRNRQPLILGRETSYTGVLIDDLIIKGTQEPYRMFTSRAECRLILRQDNADERLMPEAARRGLIDSDILEQRKRIWEKKESLKQKIHSERILPQQWNSEEHGEKIKHKLAAEELLKRPGVKISEILMQLGLNESDREVLLGVEGDIKYSGFVEKQIKEIERHRRMEEAFLPAEIDYSRINGLSSEAKVKLSKIRPLSLGLASRISGITPSDITVLINHLSYK